MGAVLTFQPHTLFLFPFPLGRGLADQQLDVGHIVGPIGQNLHKTKFKEHFQSPFHRPYLMAGEGSDGLGRMGQMVVQHEDAAAFEGHEVHFQQQIGVQQAVLHTLQNHHRFAVVKILFMIVVAT